MDVNQRLMEARKALRIPQKDFAKALCVSSSFLSDVEKNTERRTTGF